MTLRRGAPPIDTAQLGPVRIDPTKTPMRAAFEVWWGKLSRQGDPMRRVNLVKEAWDAAYQAGERAVLTRQSETLFGCPTVTIDTDSEPGSWARADRHRSEAIVACRDGKLPDHG